MTVEHETSRPWHGRPALAAAARTALAVAILTPSPALAQSGVIAGRVVDSAGDALPGVIVVAADPTATEQEPPGFAVTDRHGRYRIRNLQAGTYAVTFFLPGLGSVVQNGVDVRVLSTAAVDAELAPRVDADVPVTIGPPRVTIGVPPGSGHALDCAFRPSGVIDDCRPVLVAPRIFR